MQAIAAGVDVAVNRRADRPLRGGIDAVACRGVEIAGVADGYRPAIGLVALDVDGIGRRGDGAAAGFGDVTEAGRVDALPVRRSDVTRDAKDDIAAVKTPGDDAVGTDAENTDAISAGADAQVDRPIGLEVDATDAGDGFNRAGQVVHVQRVVRQPGDDAGRQIAAAVEGRAGGRTIGQRRARREQQRARCGARQEDAPAPGKACGGCPDCDDSHRCATKSHANSPQDLAV